MLLLVQLSKKWVSMINDSIYRQRITKEQAGRIITGLQLFGDHQITRVDITASTNNDLKADWSLAEIPQRILIADRQTAGRGQHGRVWQSWPGQALLFSFTLKETGRTFPMSLLTGLAVHNALQKLSSGRGLWLKWPNDVWLGQGKIAGVLCEGRFMAGIQHWVIGVGINLKPPQDCSIAAASFSEISQNLDAESILCEFFSTFASFCAEEESTLVEVWTKSAATFWQTRFLFSIDGQPGFIGLPLNIAVDGSLEVISEQQKSRRLLSATLKPLF